MYLARELQTIIKNYFQEAFRLDIPIDEIQVQPTRKEFIGDYTLLTFPFAATCKMLPEKLAQQLGEYLLKHQELVADFNVVKGFLNIVIADTIWIKQLTSMLQADRFGYLPPHGKKVVVEFSSPNTNKPLHLGHLRNNFLGYAVSQLLKAAGYTVYQVNLVNDRGIHICKSMVAYLRWGGDSTPASTGMKGDQFVGKYYVLFEQAYQAEVAELAQKLGDVALAKKQAPILQEAHNMLQHWEAGEPGVLALWEKMNNWVYQGFEATYRRIAIQFDKVYYESQLYLLGKQVVEEGIQQGIFYKKQDGSVWCDLHAAGLEEKLLLRADGTAVYITQDMGAVELRYQDFQTDHMVYVVGDEQNYHFEVLKAIMQKLGRSYAQGMYHLAYGMVDLPSGKMKSREGTVVDADSLIDEMVKTAAEHTQNLGKIDGFTQPEATALYATLGLGALKYFLLRVDAKKRLLFDPKASIDFQGDTGPFIQYTYARIATILRKVKDLGRTALDEPLAYNLQLETLERKLIIQLHTFPQKVQEAAENYAPNIIAQYVLGLAKTYNKLYADLPILYAKNIDQQKLRVQLSTLVAYVLQEGMKLLGIQLPERM
jgi:arginyl-tRNA synthetase